MLKSNRDMNPNGHGLGLSICKNICRKLGGDITVSSQPGQTTDFTFKVSVKLQKDCNIDEIFSARP